MKDELQILVKSGNDSITPEVEKLLEDLEKHSEGNIDIYKMRIREVLNRLTDVTIQAGGDSDALIRRNLEKTKEAEESDDPEFIRNVIAREAVELSGIIAAIPEAKMSQMVENAKRYIEQRFSENLRMNEVAEELNVSNAHLMRSFKKETRQTMNQFLNHTRINHAKKLRFELKEPRDGYSAKNGMEK